MKLPTIKKELDVNFRWIAGDFLREEGCIMWFVCDKKPRLKRFSKYKYHIWTESSFANVGSTKENKDLQPKDLLFRLCDLCRQPTVFAGEYWVCEPCCKRYGDD